MRKHGFGRSTSSLTLPAVAPMLDLDLSVTDTKRRPKWAKQPKQRFVSCEHPVFLGAAPPAPAALIPPPRPQLQRLLTFLLSHAFVLPGATKQHQPHSLSDTELRERASRLWSTDIPCLTTTTASTAARPAVVLLCVGRSLRRRTQLPPARTFDRAADQWRRCSQPATLPG